MIKSPSRFVSTWIIAVRLVRPQGPLLSGDGLLPLSLLVFQCVSCRPLLRTLSVFAPQMWAGRSSRGVSACPRLWLFLGEIEKRSKTCLGRCSGTSFATGQEKKITNFLRISAVLWKIIAAIPVNVLAVLIFEVRFRWTLVEVIR